MEKEVQPIIYVVFYKVQDIKQEALHLLISLRIEIVFVSMIFISVKKSL